MSILTAASGASVSRGYDYYNKDKVSSITQLSENEFEGYVDGTLEKPYYVKIDINHPKKSYCECPHANGNIVCKHMVALYFSIFPNEVEEYNEWLTSEYDNYNEYDDYDEYEDYEEDNYYNQHFDKPLFFDEVLKNYINSLSVDKLKEILKKELSNNEKRAYELYLAKNYNSYLNQSNESFVFLNNLNKKIQDLIGIYDYNYQDFSQCILTSKEIKNLKSLYLDKMLKKQIDEIIFIPQLAVYNDFQKLIGLYKENNTKTEIKEFCTRLRDYLNCLKHYSIRNTVPKSHILIAIYLLDDFTIKELAQSLFDNAKYFDYIDFVFDRGVNYKRVYGEFKNILEKSFLKNKQSLPYVLSKFAHVIHYQDKCVMQTYYLYSFLCLEDTRYLDYLHEYLSIEECIESIELKTKNVFLLIKLYIHFGMDDKLWTLLYSAKNKHLLLNYVELLMEKHSLELYNYFTEQFYSTLRIIKNRENYRKSARYIKAISQLNNGNELVIDILEYLEKSEYQKCIALFDEIKKALG